MTVDHRCVAYASTAELTAWTGDFLSEGVEHGEQVGFFGWGGADALRERLGGLPGVDGLLERGDARVVALDRHFRPDVAPDPGALRAYWADSTDEARRAGFPGLRVVADTTPWLQRPDQRATFLRGERMVERYRVEHPFALLCACDASRLDGDALEEIAAIHAAATGVDSPFRLHSTTTAELALGGEVDAWSAALLERVLDLVAEGDGTEELVLDVRELEFVDHRGLLALERHAERTGLAALTLDGAGPMPRRLAQLLQLGRVRAGGVR